MPRGCWYDRIRVVVRYVTDYVVEISDTDRGGEQETIDEVVNTVGLEPIRAQVYQDAMGGLVIIQEVSYDG